MYVSVCQVEKDLNLHIFKIFPASLERDSKSDGKNEGVRVCCFYSRSRKKMQNVSNLSIFTMLIMYMLSALFGYLTFYGKSNNTQKLW